MIRKRGFLKYFSETIIKMPIIRNIFVIFILELIIPFIIEDQWMIRIILFANIFVIYAIAFDLLAGYAGLVSFGHSLFFGGAGYMSALLSLHLGLPLLLCIFAGCISAFLMSLILGYVCLRLKGPYLAVATFICPLTLISIVNLSPTFLGGDNGIAGFAQIADGSLIAQYHIILGVTLASFIVVIMLARGNTGLLLKTIREDDIGAEAAGINTSKCRILAFVISGTFAGLAGSLFVHIMGSVAPTTLSLQYAMLPLFMTFLGGASSVIGPAIGAYIITYLDLYLLAFPYVRTIIYATILIIVLRSFPLGLMAIPFGVRRLTKWGSLKSANL